MLSSYLLLVLFLIGGFAQEERPIVKTDNGLIRGVYRQSRNDRKFAAFEGVPYAKPPVGELRFREPEEKDPWLGIWEATNVYQCMQINHEPQDLQIVEGTEDCLYVNIYTPNVFPDELMNVIVHFHSGAFMWGRGNLYGPNFLMDRKVVFVTLNYRLGPLGFLSTEDEVLPGNLGLKDQVMALKWIQQNIEHFGGNRDSVTITGLSAGGASTHYHFLSPLSRGLFHRGISVSGTALDNWALAENHLRKTREVGRLVGCGQQSTEDLVKCLRQRSATQIIQTVKHFQPWLYNPYSPFGPVVEKFGENKFLPDYPYELLKDGKAADLPWITSTTTEEGLYPAAEFLFNDERLPFLEEHWNEIAPYILHYDYTIPKNKREEISKKIKDYYLKGEPISNKTYPELVQAISDRLFVVDSEKAARLQAQINKSPVYYYVFSYRGDHSYSEYFTGNDNNYGVSHADDLMYITSADKSWFTKYMQSEDDKKMSDILLSIWTSFAKTGKPKVKGVKWSKVSNKTDEQFRYLHIASPTNIALEKSDYLGHRDFWDSLPFEENDKFNVVVPPNKDEL